VKLYRPATVLVGVLFVLLGGLTRLATPDQLFEEQNMQVVRGTIGEPLKYGGGDSTVTITRMKFAKGILDDSGNDDDKPIETNGVFVALEWDTVRGIEKPGNFGVTLRADGGGVYQSVGSMTDSSLDFPEPGFARTGAIVFEVNPTDLKGLTLQIRPTQFYNVLNSAVQVDLGIPSEEVAQQLVDGADAQYVVQSAVTRVASS
jgi:hypothetical protein